MDKKAEAYHAISVFKTYHSLICFQDLYVDLILQKNPKHGSATKLIVSHRESQDQQYFVRTTNLSEWPVLLITLVFLWSSPNGFVTWQGTRLVIFQHFIVFGTKLHSSFFVVLFFPTTIYINTLLLFFGRSQVSMHVLSLSSSTRSTRRLTI